MNNIYGILTDGKVTSTAKGYRYTDQRRTSPLSAYLEDLMDDAGEFLGPRANFILQLLRASSNWPMFIHLMDQNNSYDIPGDVFGHGLTMEKLVAWADSVPALQDYCTYAGDDDVSKVVAKLWGVIDGGML